MLNPQHVTTPPEDAWGASLLDQVVAYIGPGAGLGAIIIAVALFLGVTLLVAGLVWYPLKRLRKGATGDAATGNQTDASG